MIITIIIKSRKKVRRFEGFFKYKYLVIECMHVDCESCSQIFKLFNPLEGIFINPHTAILSCILISRHDHVFCLLRLMSEILALLVGNGLNWLEITSGFAIYGGKDLIGGGGVPPLQTAESR